MARGTTLDSMISMLRRELKLAESAALGQNTRDTHIHFLRTTQERLYVEESWMIRKVHRDVDLAAGQQLYSFPDDISIEDVTDVFVRYGGIWSKVEYGITPNHYNSMDPELDQRSDPVTRWQFTPSPDDDGDMVEVWPLPASNGTKLRFYGFEALHPLVADSDVCTLDDLLIVLFAAVDLCSDKEKQIKLLKAQGHLAALKSRLSKNRVTSMGTHPDSGSRRREIIVTRAVEGS